MHTHVITSFPHAAVQVSFLEEELDKHIENERSLAQQLQDLEEINKVYQSRLQDSLRDLQLADTRIRDMELLRKSVMQKDQEIMFQKEELRSKHGEMAMMQEQMSSLQDIAVFRESFVSEQQGAQTLRENISFKDMEITALREQFHHTQVKLAAVSDELDALKHSTGVHVYQDVASQQKEIAAVGQSENARVAELGKEFEVKDQLQSRDGEIITLRQQLKSSGAELQHLNDLIESKNQTLQNMQEQLDAQDIRLRGAEEKMQLSSSEIAALQLMERSLRDRLKQHSDALTAQEAEVHTHFSSCKCVQNCGLIISASQLSACRNQSSSAVHALLTFGSNHMPQVYQYSCPKVQLL
jgi:chromosome segregation ATPase